MILQLRILLLLPLTLACCVLSNAAALAADRPNVVLIMIDDFGYECVGANGGTSYATPVLDELARTGARGLHCHVQPLCTPTRVQLMTGQYNVRNYTWFGHLDPGQTTFAQLFRRAGYATCITGKWQLGQDLSLPNHFGFDQYCLWQIDRRPQRYANAGLEVDGKHVDLTGGVYGPDYVNKYACDFVAQHRDRPFLLYYPMILTHAPFQPTPDSPDWDPTTRDEESLRDVKHFGEMVTYADKLIGRLISALDHAGVRDNTLVIVLGDNGTAQLVVSQMGERSVRGGKGTKTMRGTHVPLIANWPGKIAPQIELADLIDSTDLLPTICEAAGVSTDGLLLDGRSFLPQLRGEHGNPRTATYCWYSRDGGKQPTFEFAMNTRYKLYRDGSLYDLVHDPEEETPLAEADLSDEAKAARVALQQVLDSYAQARPEAIAAQGKPFTRPPKRRGGAE
jgi:arylsulfatase A